MKAAGLKNELISVVIPVYNVEKYLDRCVESVVNQTYPQLDILLIDDGSQDRCPQLCDDWARKDKRIRVIHKQNAGLGMARNTGIEHAEGAYICFFDSDDYVALDTVASAYARAVQTEAEVVHFGLTRVNAAGEVADRAIPCTEKNSYCGQSVADELLPQILSRDPKTGKSFGLPPSACCMLVSMELITRLGWRFTSEREMISEDIYALLELYAGVSRAAIVDKAMYYYCENPASLTQVYRPDRYEKNVFFYQQCLALCNKIGYSTQVQKACVGPFFGSAISSMKQAARCLKWMEGLRQIRRIIEDETMRQVLEQKRHEKDKRAAMILCAMMRSRLVIACYCLLRLQSRRK